MSEIANFSPIRALDRDGIPVSGALAYFYASGTTTPQTVYTTAALNVAHASPLVADSQGIFAPVFSDVALRCTVTDASGTTLPGFPIDPVPTTSTGSGASEISFVPTGSIPQTNVQAAIEQVQTNLVAPLLAGGIGVTGNATVLANIDATNTASGAYRFDNTTTGTFPSAVTSSNGGTIRLWRETAAEATMEISERGSAATYQRSLTGGSWGAWSLAGNGFTPVQQNGGTGMLTNKVYVGWDGSSLLAQVDSTALGVVHTSGLSAGAVGTYCFARSAADVDAAFGTTRAGSDLLPTSATYRIITAGSGSNALAVGTALSGTWRCMGTLDARSVVGGVTELWGATLWLRIA